MKRLFVFWQRRADNEVSQASGLRDCAGGGYFEQKALMRELVVRDVGVGDVRGHAGRAGQAVHHHERRAGELVHLWAEQAEAPILGSVCWCF